MLAKFFFDEDYATENHLAFEGIKDSYFTATVNVDDITWSNCERKQEFLGKVDIDIFSKIDNEEIALLEIIYEFEFQPCWL
jgi:hypothetical protein